ncbi:MAG TPA: VWA domain-containing protein [Candidatus Angelobacter sp.]|nr:VWA domain-containing protein [Candidatus Angelobacter sp.]
MYRLQRPVFFLFLMVLAPAAFAQAAQPASPAPAVAASTPAPGAQQSAQLPTVRVRSDEVNVVFTVVDRDGKFVRDMKQDQFHILDNHLPPQKILDFRAQTDLPLYVGLLIDSSNSIRDRFQFEKDAASEFLYEIIRPKSDAAFVLAFDEQWDLTQDFTGNLDKLRSGVMGIQAGGGTALWDAVYYACREKLMKEPARNAVRRAIILVSDGEDNISRVYRDEAVDMAQRAEVVIFAISTNLMGGHTKGDENLKLLAEATGGRAFFPVQMDEVATAFRDIQEELRSQYSVSYRAENFVANGAFRPIQITTDKKFKVRAKKGYFVPQQSQAQ